MRPAYTTKINNGASNDTLLQIKIKTMNLTWNCNKHQNSSYFIVLSNYSNLATKKISFVLSTGNTENKHVPVNI